MTATLALPVVVPARARPAGPVLLRPVLLSMRMQVVIASLALFAPIYATAFIIATEDRQHHFLPVAAATAGTALVAIALAYRFARASVELRPDGVFERGMLLPGRFTPASDIGSAAIVHLYDAQTLESSRQLFLLDHDERTVLRMRGKYWSDAQIDEVAGRYGVPVETVREPLVMAELRRTHGRQLFWFERQPVLLAVAMVLGGAALATGVAIAAAWLG